MINKYNDFRLNESILILEAYLSADSSFLDKLDKMSSMTNASAPLAKLILSKINDQEWVSVEDLKQDFFKATEENDKLSFIQTNRVKGNPDPYNMSGRTDIKIGRAIKYIANDLYDFGVTDKQVEDFVNVYKSIADLDEPEFIFYEGDDILEGYDTDYHYSSLGSLGGSCMNDERSYLKIYTKNKEKVRLLALINGGQITGRALVWKLDKSPCEAKYFMDRVYTNYEHDVNKFIQYAESNDFMYKQKMGCGDVEAVKFKYKGKEVYGKIKVKLKGDFSEYPYIDTLCYLNKDLDELSNVPSWKCYQLWDTDGECERCDDCEGKSKNDDLCYGCSEGVMFLKERGIKINVEKGRK